MAARSSLLWRPTPGARPARRTLSLRAALAALAPRLVRLAHHDYSDRLLRRTAERHPRSHRAARVGNQRPQRDAPVHGDDDGDGRGARGVERRGQGERADRLGELLVVGGRSRIATARARREQARAAHRAGPAERQALARAARMEERTAGVEDVQTERHADRAAPVGRAVGVALLVTLAAAPAPRPEAV